MYYPKSKYKGELYSNGNFIIQDNNTPYTGYYYSTFDGKYFTGKFPNDGTNLPLISYSPLTEIPDPGVDDIINDFRFDSTDNFTYSRLKQIDRNTPQAIAPKSYYPQPIEDDYNVGEFTRYFSKKANENIYTETSALYQNSLYVGFSLPWLLTGDKDKVYQTNENMVMLKEQQLQISGLGAYLNFNYLKFYKE